MRTLGERHTLSPYVEHGPPFDPSYGEPRSVRRTTRQHQTMRHYLHVMFVQLVRFLLRGMRKGAALLGHFALDPRHAPTFSWRRAAKHTTRITLTCTVLAFAILILMSALQAIPSKDETATASQNSNTKSERNRVFLASRERHKSAPALWQATNTPYAFPLPMQYRNVFSPTQPHHDRPAIDLAVPQGTPMYAATHATVRVIDDRACGQGVALHAINEVVLTYCHASSLDVTNGQHVQPGQFLGRTGGQPGTRGAGNSLGEHLHFQITVNGTRRCPGYMLRAWANGQTFDPTNAHC